MRKAQFQAGEHWVLRPKHHLGAPGTRVQLVMFVGKPRAQRVKVKHLEGELAGLEEFVIPNHLECRWSEWPALQKDEKRELELSDSITDRPDGITCEAANTVFFASGEFIYMQPHLHKLGYAMVETLDTLDRVGSRAKVKSRPWNQKPCFQLRDGRVAVTHRILVDLAIAFAAVEPDAVNLYIDAQEQRYLAEGFLPGEHYKHDVMRDYKPSWALARQWAGGGQDSELMRKEIERLQGLVMQAVYALRASRADNEATRLEQALRGR